MLDRLRSLIGLPANERRLAFRALGWLAVVRLLLWLLPFGKTRLAVDRWARSRHAASASPEEGVARAVRRAVDRAARSIPGSACLAQALTAEVMLRRAGQPVRVSIGVAPDGQPLDAHAWVESSGVLVTGDGADLARYQTLAVFGSDAGVPGAS